MQQQYPSSHPTGSNPFPVTTTVQTMSSLPWNVTTPAVQSTPPITYQQPVFPAAYSQVTPSKYTLPTFPQAQQTSAVTQSPFTTPQKTVEAPLPTVPSVTSTQNPFPSTSFPTTQTPQSTYQSPFPSTSPQRNVTALPLVFEPTIQTQSMYMGYGPWNSSVPRPPPSFHQPAVQMPYVMYSYQQQYPGLPTLSPGSTVKPDQSGGFSDLVSPQVYPSKPVEVQVVEASSSGGRTGFIRDEAKTSKQASTETKLMPQIDVVIIEEVQQSWNIERIIQNAVPVGWENYFASQKWQLLHISKVLEAQEKEGNRWFPLKSELFSAFNMLRPTDVQVVILGQDPYPGMFNSLPRATGMAFSQRRGEPVSSSLKNVYRELGDTVRDFRIPSHGDLTRWARQGVLLLNTCLTIAEGKSSHGSGGEAKSPESHLKNRIWEHFVIGALVHILEANRNTIFVLWGDYAKKFGAKVKGISCKLEAAHPSGMNTRSGSNSRGFLGCNHFNKINEMLLARGKYIDWNLDAM